MTLCPFRKAYPAIADLQAAINAATAGSTLRVPSGTYGAITISKALTLDFQAGAVIDGEVAEYGMAIWMDHSDITLQGSFTVQGFSFCGIFVNGTYSNLSVDGATVDGEDAAVFGLHFQDDAHTGVSNVTISNSSFLHFTSSETYNYPAHAVYLKEVNSFTLTNVIGGYTAGTGTHSGIDIDGCTDGLIDTCDGHHANCGICVTPWPVPCDTITIRSSGGSNNINYDRFEYEEYDNNIDITWEGTCYGTYASYTG